MTHLPKILFVLSLLMISTSCKKKQSIEVQGHRGCRGLLPENSLPAFKKAVALGVNTLELDLAISKDKQVVVSHEPFMSRIYCLKPDGSEITVDEDMAYNFYQMPYDSIKQFDCGSKQHPRFPDQDPVKVYKPLLTEVIDMADALNPEIKYNIEIKARPDHDDIYTPKPEEFVGLVLDVVKEKGIQNRCNLQSFDIRVLEEIHKQAPEITLALLVEGNESINDKLKELSFKPEIISPAFELLYQKQVAHLQQNDFLVIPWTVNDEEDMEEMMAYQVDAIITDYPDRLLDLLEKD